MSLRDYEVTITGTCTWSYTTTVVASDEDEARGAALRRQEELYIEDYSYGPREVTGIQVEEIDD